MDMHSAKPEDAAGTAAARTGIAAIVARHLGGRNEGATPIAGLTIHGVHAPTEPASFLYEPSFALIACGAKRVMLAGQTYVYDASRFLLTAVGLPTVVQVLDASPSAPYYSIKLDIDLALAADLIAEVDQHGPRTPSAATGMALGPVTPAIAQAALRLVTLLDAPEDIPILARSIERELLYRVLTSPAGARLRQAVQLGTQTNRVAAAIRWIRENFSRPFSIGELVRAAGMGESTLHQHFRALTAMSPLQYQKHLRLHEARRLMLNERIDAASAAHRVGYESPTQFSREYSRLFGQPPKRDVRAIREAEAGMEMAGLAGPAE
ncbi:AraC family transcriptional regulator [Burkholderia plantarii]|uniref:AraC family transcriptional regulator n=1 Tax=Burkholderia plantarii TaxID=41899 RepID=UPI000706EBD6|nr:AraC family transcriptional regulator [Burkholderia plantarii]ALK32451.1 AraC family transcriptional regulator [Burkholderia plantarii]GLZ18999.1 AraC family transcriptional regulator [Burkholderia plantarii]